MDGKKICTNPECAWGGKELPMTEEFFQKNSNKKDGFEGRCKKCRQKYFEDYRAGKRVRAKPDKPAADPKPRRKCVRQAKAAPAPASVGNAHVRSPIVQTASPAEIVIALRKGRAAEIVAMINDKYGL
jgi:hypothetical protein